ncbi:MAG: thiamine phosphate synthase [Rhodospirillaceae bacterium]|nr:thiamine phosphate synthase [Rhodospirillaceae bacterium]
MALLLTNTRHKLKSQGFPAVWFLTDETRGGDVAAAVAALPRGCAVIFRHYGAANRAVLARELAALCRARGLLFLVAGDWRLAAAVHADGLHLPEHAAARGPSSAARLWLRGRLLTAAAHGARGLARAHDIGAHAATLAPVFPTRSHPDRAALGLSRGAMLVRAARISVLALGGASPDKLAQTQAAGFAGIAGISFALGK